jgi:hypothetical protein
MRQGQIASQLHDSKYEPLILKVTASLLTLAIVPPARRPVKCP